MIQACRHGWWTLAILAAAGCNRAAETINPEVLAAHRERLLLAEEPAGAVGVVDVREMLVGPGDEDDEDTHEHTHDGSIADEESHTVDAAPDAAADPSAVPQAVVVVVGRIGGVPNPWKGAQPDYPWSAGKAQFVIADAAAAAEVEDHGHAHEDPDHDCPFCAAAANSDVVAVVRFTDKGGKILGIDARKLFDLQGEEVVVVRGKPQMLGDAKDGVLVVEADGLYVRK